MTVLFSNNAEGGTAGTTVTTSNSGGASGNAFNLVSIPAGNTATFTSSSYDGSLAYSLGFDTTTSQGVILRWGDSNSWTTTGQRCYINLNNYPSATGIILSYFTSTPTRTASILITNSGFISIQDGTGTKFTGTNAIPLNTWIRIELYAAVGTTTSNGTIGGGWAPAGTSTLTDSYSNATANIGTTTLVRTQVGKQSGTWVSGTTMLVDDWVVTDTAAIVGPASTSVNQLYVGSSLINNLYLGSSAVTAAYIGTTKVWG